MIENLFGVTVAVSLLYIGGRAVMTMAWPAAAKGGPERWSLAFLLGTGVVSWVGWWGGLLWPSTRWNAGVVVVVLAAAVAVAARSSAFGLLRPFPVRRPRRATLVLGALLIAVIGIALLLAVRTPFSSEGVLSFETKARVIHFAGAQGLLDFLSQPWNVSLHPEYPLLLPLTEAWVYSLVGGPDPDALRPLFPLFWLCLTGLFFGALRRDTTSTAALAGCVGLALVPAFLLGAGSGPTGEANVLLAVYVFGAVSFAQRAFDDTSLENVTIAGLLAGFAAWTKLEGLILAACLAALFVVSTFVHWRVTGETVSRWVAKSTILIIGPSLVVLPWILMWSWHGIVGAGDLATSTASGAAMSERVATLVRVVASESVDVRRWATLWPAFAMTTLVFGLRLRCPSQLLLTGMVVIPFLVHSLALTLHPQSEHLLRAALPAWLMPLAPVALLATIGNLRAAVGRRVPRFVP